MTYLRLENDVYSRFKNDVHIKLKNDIHVKLDNKKQHINKSSSSYRAGSTDIPDPLSPLLPIVHRPR